MNKLDDANGFRPLKCPVAVVVPLSNRTVLTKDEQTSLRHLDRYLGKYDRYAVIPQGLEISLDGFGIKRFDPGFFGSVEAHRSLLFSRCFYEEFTQYEYILIYHLDALVFSDQLEQWCSQGFDYLGAPWIKHEDAPYSGNPDYEGKTGNGGFSLRRVDSFLAVLNSSKLWRNPVRRAVGDCRRETARTPLALFNSLARYFRPEYNGVLDELAHYNRNEDHFWAVRAIHYWSRFRVAPVNVALRFAFECVPRYCYELNGRKLPFGCHAWGRYDREFWQQFIIRPGQSDG